MPSQGGMEKQPAPLPEEPTPKFVDAQAGSEKNADLSFERSLPPTVINNAFEEIEASYPKEAIVAKAEEVRKMPSPEASIAWEDFKKEQLANNNVLTETLFTPLGTYGRLMAMKEGLEKGQTLEDHFTQINEIIDPVKRADALQALKAFGEGLFQFHGKRGALEAGVTPAEVEFAESLIQRVDMIKAEPSPNLLDSVGGAVVEETKPDATVAQIDSAQTDVPGKAFADTAKVEPEVQSESKTSQREKVFGREAMKPEDFKAVGRELGELLTADTPESLFRAAKELVHLKRAKISVSKERREEVFTKLLSKREEMQKYGGMVTSRYLMHLKYLGVIQDIEPKEQSIIEQSIRERIDQGGIKNMKSQDLTQLCVNAKYLGVKMEYGSMASHFLQEIERVNKPGDEQRVAYRLARMKYLGVPSKELDVVTAKNEKGIKAKEAEFRAKGLWDRFAKLRMLGNYIRGENLVDTKAQEEMVSYVSQAREQSQKSGKWNKFFSYVGTIVGLSERLKKNPQKEADNTDPLMAYLNSLGNSKIETTEEYLSRLSEEQKPRPTNQKPQILAS